MYFGPIVLCTVVYRWCVLCTRAKQNSEPNRTKNFRLEKTKQKYLDSFPKVVLPKVWNSFNFELKNSQALNSLKRKFKAETFSTYKSFRCLKPACYSCEN